MSLAPLKLSRFVTAAGISAMLFFAQTFASTPAADARAAGPNVKSPTACRLKTILTAKDASAAAQEGARFADRHEGYGVAAWVLYDSPDPLRAAPDRADVDAVIVETPFERIRNESYLVRFQGQPLSATSVARMRRQASGTIGFIVYAHSRSEHERGFMGGFTKATFTLSDGRRLRATDSTRFGPSSDFYTVGTFRDTRWTGALTYRFAIQARAPGDTCPLTGTLHFSDGHDRSYTYHVSLSQYR